AGAAVGVERAPPAPLRQSDRRLPDPLVDVVAKREADPALAHGGRELVRRAGRVGPGEDLQPPLPPRLVQLDRELRERGVEHRNVVGGRVRARVAGPQDPGQMLTRFVEEAVQRVEAEAALAVRAGTLLVSVTLEQLRVEVERDPRRSHAQPPSALARPPTRLADRDE